MELVLVAEYHAHSSLHPRPKAVPEARQAVLDFMTVNWSEVDVWNHVLAFS